MTESIEELVMAYWRSWQKGDFSEYRSYLADTIDAGGNELDADQFVTMVSQGSPWRDVRMIDSVFAADSAAIMYEGINTANDAAVKVIEFLRVAERKIVSFCSVFIVNGTEMAFA